MKTKRFIITILILLGKTNISFAQSILWSANNKLIKRSNYRHIIGKNKSGIYILKFKSYRLRKKIHIEKYSHGLKLQKSYSLKYGKGSLESVLLNEKGLIFFITEGKYNTGKKYLKSYFLSNNLEKKGKPNLLINSSKFNFSKEKLSIRRNKHTQNIAIVYEEIINGKAVICFDLRDSNLNKILGKRTETNKKPKEIELGKHYLTNNNDIYALVNHINIEKKKDEAARKSQYFYQFSASNQTLTTHKLEQSNIFYQDVKISSNPKSKLLYIAGFYSYDSPITQDGFLIYTIDKTNGNFIDTNYLLFHKKTVLDITGYEKNKKEDVLSYFNIKKIITRSDGGLVITAERHFISQDIETYFVNGMPHDISKNVYNYDEFVVFSIDKNLKNQWHKVLRKHQSTVNDGGYHSSVSTIVLPHRIYFLYNEGGKQNSLPVQISVGNNAIFKRTEIFANTGNNVLLFPSEATQISYNSILIPAFKNRDIALLKLTYKP